MSGTSPPPPVGGVEVELCDVKCRKKCSDALVPFIIFALLFLSLLVVAQIRGHIAGSSTPLPTTVRASHFFIANDTKCDIRVDSASGVRGGDNFRRSTKLEPARTPSIYQVRDSDNMSSPTKKRLTREAGAADESE